MITRMDTTVNPWRVELPSLRKAIKRIKKPKPPFWLAYLWFGIGAVNLFNVAEQLHHPIHATLYMAASLCDFRIAWMVKDGLEEVIYRMPEYVFYILLSIALIIGVSAIPGPPHHQSLL